MNLDVVRSLCLAKPGVTAEYPFGPQALVMKVAGKMFALIAEDADPLTISLKCDPDLAPTMRASYPAVKPGYHLNKRHWNTVTLDGSVSDGELEEWIDDSFDLVVDKLPRKTQQQLGWGS